MSDPAVIDHTIRSLVTAGLIPSRDAVIYTGIERQKFAYVVYDIDYQENIRIVREFCQERGIDLVGRFSRFEYLNMDGCIRSAIDFVRGLA
jgi:protoporphyrinogen oxidase